MKKKTTDPSVPIPIINIERADAQTYVKIKHPLRPGKYVFVENYLYNLMIGYQVSITSKSDPKYADYILLVKLIDAHNNLQPIEYRTN